MTAVTEQIFANNFWGLKDDGYQVLTAKMSNNKKTLEEIKSFYSFRATLHEEFGRKLMKHTKNSLGREELGTVHSLLKSAHAEMERTAQAHIDLSQKLKMKLEVELNNFILDQKDKKKLTSINAEKAYRYKQSTENYLKKVKEKYESECAKLITLQTQVGNLSGREAEKMKQKIERTQHEIRTQEQEYKNACRKSADATLSWNKTWKAACDIYQIMEKQRLEFIHHSFSMYVNILSTATSQDTESYERFWKTLDKYDASKDIQTFIQSKSTGGKIPEAEIFVDYMDDPAKTFQQHTMANFPIPPELVSPTTEQLLELKDEEEDEGEEDSNTSFTDSPITPIDPEPIPIVNSIERKPSLVERKPSLVERKPSLIERKPSILRSVVKPLPSITRQRSKRNSIHRLDDTLRNKPKETTPVLVVPDSPSTTDISDEEISKEEDIAIDPRAKVMFAIGNNMFDLDLKEEPTSILRRSSSRRRRPSADLEAAVNFSYQSLFEELGVYDAKPVVSDMSGAELRRKVTRKQQIPPPQQQHQRQNSAEQYHTDVEVQPRQQQVQYYNQPNYYQQPYTNTTTQVYQQNQAYHNPNPTVLFWVVAIVDWYSGKPEELQFSRGTVFGVIEVRPNGWYYAVKFESRLTNEKGFVAQNMVQLYS